MKNAANCALEPLTITTHQLFNGNLSLLCSAWIEETQIKPYLQFKDTHLNSSKSAQFKEALKQIEEFRVNPEVNGKKPFDSVSLQRVTYAY